LLGQVGLQPVPVVVLQEGADAPQDGEDEDLRMKKTYLSEI